MHLRWQPVLNCIVFLLSLPSGNIGLEFGFLKSECHSMWLCTVTLHSHTHLYMWVYIIRICHHMTHTSNNILFCPGWPTVHNWAHEVCSRLADGQLTWAHEVCLWFQVFARIRPSKLSCHQPSGNIGLQLFLWLSSACSVCQWGMNKPSICWAPGSCCCSLNCTYIALRSIRTLAYICVSSWHSTTKTIKQHCVVERNMAFSRWGILHMILSAGCCAVTNQLEKLPPCKYNVILLNHSH